MISANYFSTAWPAGYLPMRSQTLRMQEPGLQISFSPHLALNPMPFIKQTSNRHCLTKWPKGALEDWRGVSLELHGTAWKELLREAEVWTLSCKTISPCTYCSPCDLFILWCICALAVFVFVFFVFLNHAIRVLLLIQVVNWTKNPF